MNDGSVNAQIAGLRTQILLKGNAAPPVPVVAGSEVALVVPFTFMSGSMVLGTIPAGALFTCAQIEFTTPFDSSTAKVSLGTSANLGLLLGPNDSDATRMQQFCNDQHVRLDVSDLLFLTVQPGGSTQGAGTIFYRMLPP